MRAVRLHMNGNIIALIAILSYIGLAFVLYRTLATRVSRKSISVLTAGFAYCIVIAIVPWILTWVGFRLGWYIYSTYSSFYEQSWDVSLALITYLGMMLSYVLGFIFASVACRKFVILGQIGNGAHAT